MTMKNPPALPKEPTALLYHPIEKRFRLFSAYTPTEAVVLGERNAKGGWRMLGVSVLEDGYGLLACACEGADPKCPECEGSGYRALPAKALAEFLRTFALVGELHQGEEKAQAAFE